MYYVSIINLITTDQSAQSEDIDMAPPTASPVEIAAVLFAEIEKHSVNGK